MAYFKPMLTDKSLTMCQDVTPNTSEGKEMMYAITWNEDGTRLVQVGISPKRLLEETKQNEISTVVASMPFYKGIEIFVADAKTEIIKGATDSGWIGKTLETLGITSAKTKGEKTGLFYAKFDGNLCRYSLCQDDNYIVVVTVENTFYLQSTVFAILIVGVYLILASCCMIYDPEVRDMVLKAEIHPTEGNSKETINTAQIIQEVHDEYGELVAPKYMEII